MAKRSREDFEPSSSDSDPEGEAQASSLSVVQQSSRARSTATAKIVHLDHHTGGEASSVTEMRCSLPPHRQLSFTSFEEYEVHYNKTHVNRCLECRKNFPTEHFLNLHIQENHDSLNEVRKERGEKTYSCFVEDCDKVCSTAEKRRLHLIDKHIFPRDYDFYVVNDGIDRRSSMLRSGRHRRRSSAQHMADIEGRARRRHSGQKIKDTKESDESDEGESLADASVLTPPSSKEDADMDGLTGAMSALKFVPPSIRFGRGRGKGRGGFSKS